MPNIPPAVKEIRLEGIEVMLGSESLNVGEVTSVKVSPIPYNAKIDNVEYTIGDNKILRINGDKIEALKEGTTYLR